MYDIIFIGDGIVKIELDNFIIETDKEIDYMPDIISTLENDICKILDFFELENLSQKRKVIIFTNREKYKEHLLPFVSEFKEWMCADTYDGNINLLEISEARKSKSHVNMEVDEFVKDILHEFVHSCQQELNTKSEGVGWYWEGLATNLSGQHFKPISLSDCNFEELKNKFYDVNNCYDYAYTMGKYMLENYSKDILLEYVKNPDLLKKDEDKIFYESIEWSNSVVKEVKI